MVALNLKDEHADFHELSSQLICHEIPTRSSFHSPFKATSTIAYTGTSSKGNDAFQVRKKKSLSMAIIIRKIVVLLVRYVAGRII